jgi:hypothetical protein
LPALCAAGDSPAPGRSSPDTAAGLPLYPRRAAGRIPWWSVHLILVQNLLNPRGRGLR